MERPWTGIGEIVCLLEPGAAEPTFFKSGLRFVWGRLEDPIAMDAATAGCDFVLHAAGLLHVRRTADWYRVNTEGTRVLLEAALRTGSLRRFVLISSNAAAGPAERPGELLREEMVEKPLSHYGHSKLLAERIVLAKKEAAEVVVLRPCMFYGPPVPPRHVEVYRRILSGRMPLVGEGRYDRSLTYIGHLVDACRLALVHPRAPGEVFYVADRSPCTTHEVVEAMAEALGVEARYYRLPALVARFAFAVDQIAASAGVYIQPIHLLGEADWNVGVSVDKAVALLGYDPKISLREGMRTAVDWCRARRLLD